MKKLSVLAVLAAVVIACSVEQSGSEQPPKTEMKMTEASELALLMKQIHRDAKGWRDELMNGTLPGDSTEVFSKLVSSTPTNPNVKGPVYEGFSLNYQNALDEFLAAESIDLAKGAYNNLVKACVHCHQSYCTGPIPTIEKLYIKTASAN